MDPIAAPNSVNDSGSDDDNDDARLSEPVPSSRAPDSRARRLRARRLRREELSSVGVEANVYHPTLGKLACQVEDLSLSGVALSIPKHALESTLALVGDRLEKLDVFCSSGRIYSGGASIRRISERPASLVLGLEVDARGVDLAELHRTGTRLGFAERMEAVEQDVDGGVSSEFKSYVADLRTYLEGMAEFLDKEESLLDNLDRFSREQALAAYLQECAPRIVRRLNAASARLAELVRDLPEHAHQSYRRYYKRQLLHLMCRAPIFKRASSKPLGYAGDYEVMNMLYRDSAEGGSLFAQAVNSYAAQEPAARAVVNRLDYLAEKIHNAIDARGKVRLASIGCGPAEELAKLLQYEPELGASIEIALIDQEERVITYCEKRLAPLVRSTGVKIHFIRESIRRLLATRRLSDALGERDLIYSAGLFDYLDVRTFQALLGALYDAIRVGGQLVIGNYSMHNESRYFMEYCLDWYLIHRDEAELVRLSESLTPSPSRIVVDSEPLGVNIFLNVWK